MKPLRGWPRLTLLGELRWLPARLLLIGARCDECGHVRPVWRWAWHGCLLTCPECGHQGRGRGIDEVSP